MAFSAEDLAQLSEDFVSQAGGEILRPRATERMQGGNAGFSHFTRAVDRPPVQVVAKRCHRCRLPVVPGRSLCLRHLEEHRKCATRQNRRKGVREWRPGGPGRTPLIALRGVESAVAVCRMLLADALSEQAVARRKVAQLKKALTQALKSARAEARF